MILLIVLDGIFAIKKNDTLWPVKDTDMQQDNARRKTADSSERCRAEALDWVITQSNLNKQKTCK